MQKRDHGGTQRRIARLRIIPPYITKRLQLVSSWRNGSHSTTVTRGSAVYSIERQLKKRCPNLDIEIQISNSVQTRVPKSFFVRINFVTSRKLLYVTTIPKKALKEKLSWRLFWVLFSPRSQNSRIYEKYGKTTRKQNACLESH